MKWCPAVPSIIHGCSHRFQNPSKAPSYRLGYNINRSDFDVTCRPARQSFTIYCNSSESFNVIHHFEEKVDESEINSIISEFTGRLSAEKCVDLLRQMKGEKNSARLCLRFFDWMRLQRPSLLTPVACSVLFNLLTDAGMCDQLMITFENLTLDSMSDILNVDHFNVLLSALVRCRRYDDAWKSFQVMQTMNISPDHVTCLIMFTVMRESGKKSKAFWDFWETMNGKGVEWNPEISCELIKSFCDDGLKKEALIILIEMENKGFPANVLAYNILIDAYCQSDQIGEAEGLFTEMKIKGLKPTVDTFNIFLKAYSLRVEPEIVETLLKEMLEAGLEPNELSYASLISSYAKQKKTYEMAVNAFRKMKELGIRPSVHSYTALIQAHAVGGYHEMALIAFDNMLESRISPSVETYTHMIAAFRWQGDPEIMMKIWNMMRLEQVEVTPKIYHSLLDGLAERGLFMDARYVFVEMEKLGLLPTIVTYNILMKAYTRGGQQSMLPQLIKEMETRNLKPDSFTYVTMIYAYVGANDFKRAFLYHKLMVKNGQLPDSKSYEKLRTTLDSKAAKTNKKDKVVILKILNSKFGSVKAKKRGKKDEFWKYRSKRVSNGGKDI